MKKLVLIIVLVLSITAIFAQKSDKLSDFGNNKDVYMKTVFVDRKADFIGKPLSELVNVWEKQLPGPYFILSSHSYSDPDPVKRDKIDGLLLYDYALSDIDIPAIQIEIGTTPYDFYETRKMYPHEDKRPELTATPEIYKLFKNYIVKDIFFCPSK